MSDYIKEKIASIEQEIIDIRRDLHKHPETGWLEFRTAAVAIKKMQELGYTITMGEQAIDKDSMMGLPSDEELKTHQDRAIAQGADKDLVMAMTGGLTGFWGDMKFSDDNYTMALRFDIDANDVSESQEESHRPAKENFASVNPGMMHACGHDAHVAMGLGIAEVIAGMKDKLKGNIRIIFQPGEEGSRGAGPMVTAGAIDGVDYIIGFHASFQAPEAGDLICGTKGFLATTKWDVTFTGLASHAGAAPQEGKNALLAASVAALNLHAISRHSDGVTRINVGKLVAGEGRNVLPPNALLVMETRGETSELDDYLVKESERIIKAAALMYDCTYDIRVMGSGKSGESSLEVIEFVGELAKTMPYFTNIIPTKDLGACEDFSHMMSEVQKNGGLGTYMQIGIPRTAGHHNKFFDLDESGFAPAMELVCRCVEKILGK